MSFSFFSLSFFLLFVVANDIILNVAGASEQYRPAVQSGSAVAAIYKLPQYTTTTNTTKCCYNSYNIVVFLRGKTFGVVVCAPKGATLKLPSLFRDRPLFHGEATVTADCD